LDVLREIHARSQDEFLASQVWLGNDTIFKVAALMGAISRYLRKVVFIELDLQLSQSTRKMKNNGDLSIVVTK